MSTHGCTCWEPGVVDDPDCPRHGRYVDDEVDRRSDAAADRADALTTNWTGDVLDPHGPNPLRRADTIVDRYDPDDRQPNAGDPYWSEEPSWDD